MTEPSTLNITYLPPDAAVAELVADWQWREWPYGSSLEQRRERLLAQREQQQLPCTLVAWQQTVPVGAASLILDDLPTRPDWNPWLASVVVEPHLRGTGIGTRLCQQAVRTAAQIGIPRLYLFTPDAMAFYERLGWRSLESLDYRGQHVTVMDIALEHSGTANRTQGNSAP